MEHKNDRKWHHEQRRGRHRKDMATPKVSDVSALIHTDLTKDRAIFINIVSDATRSPKDVATIIAEYVYNRNSEYIRRHKQMLQVKLRKCICNRIVPPITRMRFLSVWNTDDLRRAIMNRLIICGVVEDMDIDISQFVPDEHWITKDQFDSCFSRACAYIGDRANVRIAHSLLEKTKWFPMFYHTKIALEYINEFREPGIRTNEMLIQLRKDIIEFCHGFVCIHESHGMYKLWNTEYGIIKISEHNRMVPQDEFGDAVYANRI